MYAEQAIFTSLARRGRSGYHLVARSPGLTESEAAMLSTWSPSHGGLIVDGANHVSVNYYPLPSGRYVVSRTREGRAEYSGRGGKQLYTHALVIDAAKLQQSGYQPFAIYRDALALGHLRFRADPPATLRPVELSGLYPRLPRAAGEDLVRELGLSTLESIVTRLDAGQTVAFAHGGDRAVLAEYLTGRLAPETLMKLSFATSLHPSTVRPYRLNLVAPR